MTTTARAIHCALCGRKLPAGEWVYSRWTRAHYCYPGRCKKRRKTTTA